MTCVEIFTDGACSHKAGQKGGKGGYACILRSGPHYKEVMRGYRLTTNNRMELMAAIAGLGQLKKSSNVIVYTDSKYVCLPFQEGWVERWRTNRWRKSIGGKPIANADLWMELCFLVQKHHSVTFEWVCGHNGHPENERVDFLARESMATLLDIDAEYERTYGEEDSDGSNEMPGVRQ